MLEQGIVKSAPIFAFNMHQFSEKISWQVEIDVKLTIFRGFFTSFSAEFSYKIRGKGSEKAPKHGQKIFPGKLPVLNAKIRANFRNPCARGLREILAKGPDKLCPLDRIFEFNNSICDFYFRFRYCTSGKGNRNQMQND